MASKCTKAYTVTSNNSKMSGSVKPKSYMGGGMVKSYQKGGLITMPRKTAKQEMMSRMMEDPRKAGAYMRNAKIEIEMEPRYSSKERMEMERVKGEEMGRRTRRAYEKATGRKL